jgi:hypothetical protein
MSKTCFRYLAGRCPAYVEEYRVITKSGEIRWHRATGKIVARDAGGRSVRVVGTNTDITERMLDEQRLQEANLELEQQVAARTADLQATVAELLYTKLMTGATPFRRDACRLHELCTVAHHSVKPKAAAKQLHVAQ